MSIYTMFDISSRYLIKTIYICQNMTYVTLYIIMHDLYGPKQESYQSNALPQI